MKTGTALRPPYPRLLRPGPGAAAAAAAVVLSVLVAGTAVLVRLPVGSRWSLGMQGFALLAVMFVLYGLGSFLVSRTTRGRAVSLTLGGAAAMQLAALTAPARYSDDLYRYVWDGRVQAHGIDPYRYVPVASRLVELRTPDLFPAGHGNCVTSGPDITAGCTLLNRPLVHTIYPPVAQAYFWAVHWSGTRGIQVSAAVAAVLVAAVLVLGLPRLGADPRQAVLWAWCPLVAIEAGNNGHVDVVAMAFTAAAVVILAARRPLSARRAATGGAVLGLAIATKVTPALLLPSVVRRRPLPLLASLCGVVAAVYVPHVAAVGGGATGFLSGYLNEEGYDSGRRFAVLDLLLPASWATPAALVILATTAVLVWWHSDPGRPWHGAAVMTGVTLVVAAPSYAWYAQLLVLMVAFGGWSATPWLAVALAGYAGQLRGHLGWSYGAAALFVAGVWLVQRRTAARARAVPVSVSTVTDAADTTDAEDAASVTQTSVDVILPCLDEAAALPPTSRGARPPHARLANRLLTLRWRIGQTDVPNAPRTGKSKVTGTVGGTVKAVGDMRKFWKAASG